MPFDVRIDGELDSFSIDIIEKDAVLNPFSFETAERWIFKGGACITNSISESFEEQVSVSYDAFDHSLSLKGLQQLNTQNISMQILSFDGQLNLDQRIEANHTEVKLDQMPSGIYIVRLLFEDTFLVKKIFVY